MFAIRSWIYGWIGRWDHVIDLLSVETGFSASQIKERTFTPRKIEELLSLFTAIALASLPLLQS